ncbi:MAG: Hpt domain-containing protein [Chloroflexi bacterium]|nr:Hpt domain-containing protein [Chloroflexota bacterium]
MSADLDKYRALYFAEAQEQLVAINRSLEALAEAPQDRTELTTAFRAAHTLKAMSATMGYGELTRAAHALEDLLARTREQNETPSEITLRLLHNAAEDINVRLRRAETTAIITAVEEPAAPDALAQILTSPLRANVRVHQQDLNLLLEIVAELAVSSNLLEHAALENKTTRTDAAVRTQRELVSQVRRLTWQLNMAPIGPVFDRYARVLQELARQQNKTMRVVTQGVDVELCHAMLDELNEPFLHLLRNAVTHGVELPAERTWAHKDPVATITLRAQRNGDRVLIQVGDDGRGMDAGAILQAAYSQGLVSREKRRSMNARDALRLILLPNFSMSRTVTQNAGRGIGMSVVQEHLNAVGGSIEIKTELGHGSIFTLDVPRLVGLIEVELVRKGAKVYAIPTAQIQETRVWLPAEIEKRVKSGSLNKEYILDVESLRTIHPHALANPAGVSLVELAEPQGVAFCVDELLDKALLNYPFAVRAAAIPILDPAVLFS